MAEREQARRSQNVTMVMVKMRKGNVKNRHYNINILFIYSEQMTASEIDFDHFDLDHFDREKLDFFALREGTFTRK